MKDFIKKLLSKEIIRFLIGGGVNTLMGGILIPLIFRQILTTQSIVIGSITLDLPLTIGYLIWFTFAYLIQVKFVFKTKFYWKRYCIYPFSQIPNYLLNQLFLYLFGTLAALPHLVSYVLAALCPIPIMFVIIRLIVKPLKKNIVEGKKEEKNLDNLVKQEDDKKEQH